MLISSLAFFASVAVLSPQSQPAAPDVSRSPISKQPVGGVLRGVPFRPTRVEVRKQTPNQVRVQGRVVDEADSYVLRFRSGEEFFADQEVEVWLLVDRGAKLAPRTIQWRPYEFGTEEFRRQFFPKNNRGGSTGRGISMVMIGGEKLPKDPNGSTFNDQFSAHIKLESFQGGVLRGQIALVVPDRTQSYLNGTFRATLTKS